MRRQDKYPDTEVFHYFNANPKNRITTDCVVRAICLATQKVMPLLLWIWQSFSVRLAMMTVISL